MVLILGCLIVLVVQQSSKPWNQPENIRLRESKPKKLSPAADRTVSYLPVTNSRNRHQTNSKPTLGQAPNRTQRTVGPGNSRVSGTDHGEPFDDSGYGHGGVPAAHGFLVLAERTTGQAGIFRGASGWTACLRRKSRSTLRGPRAEVCTFSRSALAITS